MSFHVLKSCFRKIVSRFISKVEITFTASEPLQFSSLLQLSLQCCQLWPWRGQCGHIWLCLAMSFFDSWPAIIGMKINEMWPYLAFGKNFAHFWPFLVNFGPSWPNFAFQLHIHKSLLQRTNFSKPLPLRIFRFSWKLCLLEVFKKHFVKFLFQFETFTKIVT